MSEEKFVRQPGRRRGFYIRFMVEGDETPYDVFAYGWKSRAQAISTSLKELRRSEDFKGGRVHLDTCVRISNRI